MNRLRHRGRRICLRALKIAGGLVALVLLVFVLIQAVLTTPWMRGKVAEKLSQRIGGLDVGIGDLDWTPWGGATVRGLRIEQPDALKELVEVPLLEVDEIHVWPVYRSALRGDWTESASEVAVVRPRIHVSAEMLVSIAASSVPAAVPPDAVARVAPEQVEVESLAPVEIPVGAPTTESPSSDSTVGNSSMDGPSGAPAAEKPAESAAAVRSDPDSSRKARAETSAPPPPPKVTRKRMRMVVKEGVLELVRAGAEGRLAAIEGVDFDLSLFGDATESGASVDLIECLGQAIDEDLYAKTRSEGQRVVILMEDEEERSSKVFGRITIGLTAGIPFQTDLGVRLAGLDRMQVFEELSIESGEIQARFQGGGWLQAPGSWRGVSRFGARDPVGRLADSSLAFEIASGSLQISGGVIQSPDFRLIGDSISILGNGWATSRDGAVVVRVVVPFSMVGPINGQLGERIPESVFAFRPLKPDNRWYSDVSLWRGEKGWLVEFGESGSGFPVVDLLELE